MLTKSDLQQIGNVVDQKLNPVKTTLGVVQKDLKVVQKDLKVVQKDLKVVQKDLKVVRKRVKKTEGTVDIMIDQFDREIVGTQKRVKKIEDHLSLPTGN